MPIEIRHDVPIAASAGLAALAGTAQAQIGERAEQQARSRIAMQLDAQAQRQHMQIQAATQGQQRQIEAASAQAHQQAEYAKDRLGLRAGLQEELQDQKFQQAMEGMEQEAQIKASQFTWEMDTTAKKAVNRARADLAYLDTEAARDLFTEDQILNMRQRAQRQVMYPSLTPKYAEPQPEIDNLADDEGNKVALNQPFTNKQGAIVVFRRSSRGFIEPIVLQHYNQTEKYFTQKIQQEQQQVLADRMQKRRDEADKYARDLETKYIETWDGSVLATKKPYGPGEINAALWRNFPDVMQAEVQERKAAKAEQLQEAGEEEFYRRRSERKKSFLYDTRNIEVSVEDADLTIEQQKAQGVIRKALRLKKAERDISEMMPLIQAAQEILKESQRSKQ